MKEEITGIAAEVVEKGTEAVAYVAGEALECTCTGARVVLDVAGNVVGKVLSTVVSTYGPK